MEDYIYNGTGDNIMDEFMGRFGYLAKKNPNGLRKTIVETNPELVTMNSNPMMKDPTAHLNADGFTNWLQENNKLNEAYDGTSTAQQTWGKDITLPETKSIGAEPGSRGKNLLGTLGADTDQLTQGKGALATKKMGAGDYAQLAMAGVQIGSSFSGKQFDTSAEGSGPGKAGGHIIGGAATGFQAGMQATGNPLIAGGMAVVGALGPALGHRKAMREWRENQTRRNREKDAVANRELEDMYAMSQGMASMSHLQDLRKKQLGMLS